MNSVAVILTVSLPPIGLRYNCRLGARNSFNQITSYLDAGTTYSNKPEVQHELR